MPEVGKAYTLRHKTPSAIWPTVKYFVIIADVNASADLSLDRELLL
jgi:hypothetical protein